GQLTSMPVDVILETLRGIDEMTMMAHVDKFNGKSALESKAKFDIYTIPVAISISTTMPVDCSHTMSLTFCYNNAFLQCLTRSNCGMSITSRKCRLRILEI